MYHNGTNRILLIKIDGTFIPIGCLTSNSFSESSETIETTTKDNAGWATSLPTNQSYEISFDGLLINDLAVSKLSLNGLRDIKRNRTLIEWQIKDTTGFFNDTGFGYITSLSESASLDEFVTFSGNIVGYGIPNSEVFDPIIINGLPTITSEITTEVVLTAVPASVSGTPTPTTTWQWQRSDNGVNGWNDISGATSISYTLSSTDLGKYLRVVQIETNSNQSVSAESLPTNQFNPEAPNIVSNPVISGTPNIGETLTVISGDVTGFPTPTNTYQWQRSSDGISGWSNISGATNSTYVLVEADRDNYIRVVQTATNASGTDSANSDALPIDLGVAPNILDLPTISGTEQVGETLTATPSATTGNPTPTNTYQWQRSDDGLTGWADISGATSSTYVIQFDDISNYLRVVQTATNLAGSDTANSLATNQIVSLPNASTIAYVTSAASNSLTLIDITNPSNMTEINSYTSLNINGARGIALDVSNDVAYIASWVADSLTAMNIQDSNNLIEISSLTDIQFDTNRAVVLDLTNNIAYIHSPSRGSVTSVNITDSSNMSVLDTITGSIMDVWEIALNSTKDILFAVTGLLNRITAINVTNPGNMIEVGSYTSANLGNARGIALDNINNIAYVASRTSNTITAIDISNPSNMTELDSYTSANLQGATAISIDLVNNVAYVASNASSSITAIDISTPTAMSEIDSYTSVNLQGARDIMLDLVVEVAYVTSAESDSITSIDISTPSNLIELDSYTSATLNSPWGIALK